ncbi:MAG: membrane lipoprotein lipid attachment site-containing protein [Oscillospiraceae bacterium]|nr:membrane lipoprotein lipid attachment site-containing protein [Oscillospiraceae bacterium]
MKKYIAFLLAVLILLTACSNEQEKAEYNPKTTKYEVNEVYDEDAPVEMNVVSASESGITLELVNNTDMEGIFGEHFYICFEQDGKWYRLPQTAENVGFNDIGLFLDPNGKREYEHSFEWIYSLLPAGRYRIVKDIRLYKDMNSHESEKYTLAAEFEVG